MDIVICSSSGAVLMLSRAKRKSENVVRQMCDAVYICLQVFCCISGSSVYFSPHPLRYGYPFFLFLYVVDAMLETVNPSLSVHQTPYYYCCFFLGCVTNKERSMTHRDSPTNLSSITSDNHKLHIFPTPFNS